MIRKHIPLSFLVSACLLPALSGCGSKGGRPDVGVKENREAKRLLQGVWLNEDDESVAFRIKGDTVFYPDSTVQPMYFYVAGDTLVMRGSSDVRYPIVRQMPHLFEFKTASGDVLKLSKTDDKGYLSQFSRKPAVVLNQQTVVKRDSVVALGDKTYHVYVQVNPTSFKVLRSTYTDEGVSVDNVYYDNIVNVNVYAGARKVFARDFRKADFAKRVPSAFLSQSILSDMVYSGIDVCGVHYMAIIAQPGSSVSYQVEVVVGFDGKMSIR